MLDWARREAAASDRDGPAVAARRQGASRCSSRSASASRTWRRRRSSMTGRWRAGGSSLFEPPAIAATILQNQNWRRRHGFPCADLRRHRQFQIRDRDAGAGGAAADRDPQLFPGHRQPDQGLRHPADRQGAVPDRSAARPPHGRCDLRHRQCARRVPDGVHGADHAAQRLPAGGGGAGGAGDVRRLDLVLLGQLAAVPEAAQGEGPALGQDHVFPQPRSAATRRRRASRSIWSARSSAPPRACIRRTATST